MHRENRLVPPCGEGEARIELGSPWGDPAEFRTSGGILYATAFGFGHGAVGDSEVGLTRLDFGRGNLGNVAPGPKPEGTVSSVRVVEDDYAEIELEAGQYWVVASNSAQVAIVSCEAEGVSSVDPSSNPVPGTSPVP